MYTAILEGTSLKDVKLLYKATPNTKKGQHWGSRIVFDQEGHLYFGVGDRGNMERDLPLLPKKSEVLHHEVQRQLKKLKV